VGFQPVGVFTANGRKFGRYWDVAWYERPAPDEGDVPNS
jgi:phosphinothricin acetyltransferase